MGVRTTRNGKEGRVMATHVANFVPPARVAMLALRRRRRMWGMACAAYMFVAAGVCGSIAASSGVALPSIRHDLEREERKGTGLREAIARTSARIGDTNKRLETSRLVRLHPDWSGIFRLIAEERGNEVVLEGCDLRPVWDSGSGANAKTEKPTIAREYTLALSGLAASQKAVSNYVLALENSGAFQTVQRVETRTRTEGKQQLVGFTVRCTLTDRDPRKSEAARPGAKGTPPSTTPATVPTTAPEEPR